MKEINAINHDSSTFYGEVVPGSKTKNTKALCDKQRKKGIEVSMTNLIKALNTNNVKF